MVNLMMGGAVVLTALVITLTVMQWQAWRQIHALKSALQAATERQEAMLRGASGMMVQLGQSLQGLEQRVTHNERRQQDMESKEGGGLTYAQASKLVRMGADTDDLVRSCGLSEAEAKLVSLMAARGVGRPS